jgi:hypothetical protein
MIEPFNFRPETTKGLPAASCELRADHESFTICWLAAQIQILRTVAQNELPLLLSCSRSSTLKFRVSR